MRIFLFAVILLCVHCAHITHLQPKHSFEIDDTEMIREALTAGVFVGEGGRTYHIRSPIVITNDVALISDGGVFTLLCHSNRNLLKFSGSESLAGTTKVKTGDSFLLLPGHGILSGSWIKVQSFLRDWHYDQDPSRNYRKGSLQKVSRVGGDTLFLADQIYCDIDSAGVFLIDPITVKLDNVVIKYTEKRESQALVGLDLRYCVDSQISNSEFHGGVDENILLAHSYNVDVRNCVFKGSNHHQNGFGLWVGSSAFIRVTDSYFEHFFKGIDFSSVLIPTRHAVVSGCQFVGGGSAWNGGDLFWLGQRAVSSHATAQNILVTGNLMHNVYTAVVAVGVDFAVLGNVMSGRANTFVQVRTGGVTVQGNIYHRPHNGGIFRFIHVVSADTSLAIRIKDNTATMVTGYFVLNNVPDLKATITGNEVQFFDTSGYFIAGGQVDGLVQNNLIKGL